MLGARGTVIKGQMRQKPNQWRTWRTSESGWFCDHTKPNCVDLPGLSTFSSGVKMTALWRAAAPAEREALFWGYVLF